MKPHSLVPRYRVLLGEAYDLIKTRHFSPYHLLSTIKSKPESSFLSGVNGMNCWQKLAADPYSVTGQPCVTFFWSGYESKSCEVDEHSRQILPFFYGNFLLAQIAVQMRSLFLM
jgi:hypothetical protein